MLNLIKILGWLGIVLGILSIVNIVTGTLINIWEKQESFSWKKMIKGISKILVFYLSSCSLGIAFGLLPYINEMITCAFNVELLSNELLNSLSSIGVLSIIISTIVTQGDKAVKGIIALSKITSNIKE